jgi:peptide deformylase
MTITKIITTPNPFLRQVSTPINKLDKKTLKIIREVQETLKAGENPRGVGLSAVQIAKLIRIFCTYLPPSGDPDDKNQRPVIKTYINPEILETSKAKTLGLNKEKPILEGCLSIPGIWGPVWRHKWVKLKCQMENGKWQTKKFKDFPARVVQHEIDHLNGVLFTDHSLRDKLPLYESKDEELSEIKLL